MTKQDVVNEIANKSGIEKKEVSAIIEGFLSIVTKSVIAGEGVYIRGFGSFERKRRAAKTARNISAKTMMIVPAHDVPVFKVSKEFKEALK